MGNVIEVWVPDDECEAARPGARAGRRKGRLSAALKGRQFLLRHGLVFQRNHSPDKGGATDRRPLGMDQRHKLRGEGRQRGPRVLRRRREAEVGGQEAARGPRQGRGLQGKVAQEGRLHPMPQGNRRHERRRPGFRGRRVLQVQKRQVLRRMARTHPLRALQRRKREARRHHQGRQQAPATGARRVGLALS